MVLPPPPPLSPTVTTSKFSSSFRAHRSSSYAYTPATKTQYASAAEERWWASAAVGKAAEGERGRRQSSGGRARPKRKTVDGMGSSPVLSRHHRRAPADAPRRRRRRLRGRRSCRELGGQGLDEEDKVVGPAEDALGGREEHRGDVLDDEELPVREGQRGAHQMSLKTV
uniref:Uncharacterized protein n=1 Tax=Oryza sativa subsp. japonica TaxID=39947 RepID=Q7XB81_ORYSJ|nr:hypothetical protein [Oryza sativa Japonica Group]BAD31009.1 hypothetical protein [Oryza sativa Japonica Group]